MLAIEFRNWTALAMSSRWQQREELTRYLWFCNFLAFMTRDFHRQLHALSVPNKDLLTSVRLCSLPKHTPMSPQSD